MTERNGQDRSFDGVGSGADDVALKAAIRRAVGGERAPMGLHQRVTAALAAAAASEAIAAQASQPQAASGNASANAPQVVGRIGPSSAARTPWWKYAAAAIFFIAATGLVAYEVLDVYPIGRHAQKSMVAQLPKQMAVEMVQAHEAFAAKPDTQLLAQSKNDVAVVRQKLAQQFGHPVLAGNPGSGWELKGAAMTKVGERPTAQLLFTRGTQTMSLMSLPAPRNYPPADGTTYEESVDGHAIAGAAFGGMMYCVVESAANGSAQTTVQTSVDPKEALQIWQQVGNPMSAACGTSPATTPADDSEAFRLKH